jgi:hypothetical protein
VDPQQRDAAVRRKVFGQPDPVEDDGWVAQDLRRRLAAIELDDKGQNPGQDGRIAGGMEEQHALFALTGEKGGVGSG